MNHGRYVGRRIGHFLLATDVFRAIRIGGSRASALLPWDVAKLLNVDGVAKSERRNYRNVMVNAVCM